MSGALSLHFSAESYDDSAKAWLAKSGHYLDNPHRGASCVLLCVRRGPTCSGTLSASETVWVCVFLVGLWLACFLRTGHGVRSRDLS